MELWPEIIITERDSPEVLLAITVIAGGAETKQAEDQLKRYMVGRSCPVGMLVTWDETRFYRNRYTGNEPDSVKMIGACATGELLEPLPPSPARTDSYLLLLVKEWLGGLRLGERRTWPPSAAEAIEIVVPEVASGIIRSTGPRLRRTGS